MFASMTLSKSDFGVCSAWLRSGLLAGVPRGDGNHLGVLNRRSTAEGEALCLGLDRRLSLGLFESLGDDFSAVVNRKELSVLNVLADGNAEVR